MVKWHFQNKFNIDISLILDHEYADIKLMDAENKIYSYNKSDDLDTHKIQLIKLRKNKIVIYKNKETLYKSLGLEFEKSNRGPKIREQRNLPQVKIINVEEQFVHEPMPQKISEDNIRATEQHPKNFSHQGSAPITIPVMPKKRFNIFDLF